MTLVASDRGLGWRRGFAGSLPLALVIVLGVGCGGGTTTGSQGTNNGASSGSTSAAAGASSTSGGAAGSSIGTGGSGASSAGSSGTAGATSTGTGAGGRAPDFVDGGYVSCSGQVISDAGTDVFTFMCTPGTYFCQTADFTCAQCLSDADCVNETLPTYEPSRQRCDLDSGVRGYQNFCQECVGNADCASNALDTQCDLNPSSVEPSIDAIGFETCVDHGPGCPGDTQPAIGGCASYSCMSDSDCAQAVSSPNTILAAYFGYSGQQAEPFCVNGQCANSPDDDELCPNCYCQLDSYCRDPRAICDVLDDHCACTDSSQCGGPWPICEIGGDVLDGGDAGLLLLGACGCRTDQDCGDGGLRCLDLPADDALYGGPACLFDCNDPRFPGCANLSPTTPLCDVASGLCGACETDQQCRTQATGLFVGPFCRDDGICGCQVDSDCPDHETCGGPTSRGGAGGLLGQCIPPPLRCTPASCPGGDFCDLDGGTCEPIAGARVCASDLDCAYVTGVAGGFCEPDAGTCVACLADADCVANGSAAADYTHCLDESCSQLCASDQNCAHNPGGAHCLPEPQGLSAGFCGCTGDADCTGVLWGSRCNTDAGVCGCADLSDCPAGDSCQLSELDLPACSSYCRADTDCPADFFCSEFSTCLPRCDDGGGGCQAPFLACDRDNYQGGNGIGLYAAPDPGAVWCYQCVSGDDCGPGLSCYATTCGDRCYGEHSCHTGEMCGVVDDLCHASCDGGACPAGQFCDTDNAVGNGSDSCYECLSAANCPAGEGCSPATHSCGSCQRGSDCPPDAICSTFWPTSHGTSNGVCLQNCDVFACPKAGDICAVLPSLTPDHRYCFGCLEDSDCGDGGARCDTLGLTFTCQLPAAP